MECLNMIDSIEIKGFKSIDERSVKLKPLTILSGINSSGKSSLIQSLRMCLDDGDLNAPILDELGEYDEIKSIFTPLNQDIEFKVESEFGVIELTIGQDDVPHRVRDFEVFYEYISADRHGPKTYHQTIKGNRFSIGSRGDFLVDYYEKFQNVIVHELLRHPEASGHTLKHQLPYWMNEVCPGVSFEFAVDRKHDISHIEINNCRATNTGFGISYSLPIVMSLLTLSSDLPKVAFDRPQTTEWLEWVKKNGAMVMIENPEAHLHPKGQTFMGHLAALASTTGLQLVIETHSDHFIDGVRIAVKELEPILSENVIIHFFEREADKSSTIEEIIIGDDGKLSKWPKGFFDQVSENLRKLNRKG